MDWQSGRRSDNVEDQRGWGVRRGATLSGGAVLLVVVGALLGKSPAETLRLLAQGQREQTRVSPRRPPVAGPDW
jgi:predicted metalloprotease